ncbi:fatty acid synthase-like [Solenopsis invicta]|uniref:fatty acid synthase-like n=1 Tax=Solenopsis invicta TaxID=13686 RepID=UPI00193DA550|nr:fatty acid synthase-like [Solenopsis invicta]
MDDKKVWNGTDSGEEVVISGIAGRFPNSDNMHQLRENLFNKVDLVREDHGRWNIEHSEIPKCLGTINNVEKFDADFFGLSFEQAHAFTPEARLLMEHAYEAIIDAGINPKQLKGKNTAVIIAVTYVETQEKFIYENLQLRGQNMMGSSKSTLATILSSHFDLKGPSHTIDTACSSSFYALAAGYDYIVSGTCEDAIIGSANICFNPWLTLQFLRLGVLSFDGHCRPFDIKAHGYARSEAVAVAYLQKAKNAKRIYAICPHIKLNNDGYKKEGVTFPSSHVQSTLLMEFYDECGIPNSCLDYIETHGTATKVGNSQEVNALQNVLCKNRETPLMTGSVKSNLGHPESAATFCQIAKQATIFLKISLKCELVSRPRWRLEITPVAALDLREGLQRRGHLAVCVPVRSGGTLYSTAAKSAVEAALPLPAHEAVLRNVAYVAVRKTV